MFFLTTQVLIGKYYQNVFTQFIIGCTFYMLTFLIIKDIISNNSFNEHKYYILILIIIDASYMIYKIKSYRDNQKRAQLETLPYTNKPNNQTIADVKKINDQSVTLSSEIYGIKITHDLSIQDPNNEKNQMFSSSDEKSDKLVKQNRYNLPSETNKDSEPNILSDSLSELSIKLDSLDSDDLKSQSNSGTSHLSDS